jgi:GGDEF domain-containing protein
MSSEILIYGPWSNCDGWSRESDICARVGGDEFVVIIEDTHATQVEGRLVADRIKAALTAGVAVLGPHTMRVGVSIGVAVSSAASQPRDLLEEADIAMYGTKTQTRPEQSHLHQSGGKSHRIAPSRLPGTGVVHAVVRHAELAMWTAIARRSVRPVQG